MRGSGNTITVFGVANRHFIQSVWGLDPFRTGLAITSQLRTANQTIGPVLSRAQTLNWTTVRFSWVQVQTTVLNQTLPSLKVTALAIIQATNYSTTSDIEAI